jgi:hypothetical protein
MKVKLITKQRIMEAPLMDILPTYVERGVQGVPAHTKNVETVINKPSFKPKLQKLLQNFPVNIWLKNIIEPNMPRSDEKSRVRIFDLETIKKDPSETRLYWWHIPKEREVIEAIKNIPSQDCLIIAESGRPNEGNIFISPWMILHAFFDSGYTFHEKYLNFDSKNQIENSMETIGSIIIEQDERNQDKKRLEQYFKKTESIFTFGSARNLDYTRSNERSTYGLIGSYAFSGDYVNEVYTQCLTTKGFQYNEQAVQELIQFLELDEFDGEDLIRNLEEIKRLSPIFKQNMADFFKGKLVIVEVL